MHNNEQENPNVVMAVIFSICTYNNRVVCFELFFFGNIRFSPERIFFSTFALFIRVGNAPLGCILIIHRYISSLLACGRVKNFNSSLLQQGTCQVIT